MLSILINTSDENTKGVNVSKKNAPPLIIEDVQERANYMYLSIIEYKRENYLAIVDNVKDNEITAYVLDQAKAENVDVSTILRIATRWYYKSSDNYPISFEFAKLGIGQNLSAILKTFKIDYVSRLIGKSFTYDFDKKPKVKRKRVTMIPSGVEIKFKRPQENRPTPKISPDDKVKNLK